MARDREQLESMLSAYLDGELTQKERAEVEAFLADDADARRLLDDLRETITGLGGFSRAKVSNDFSDAMRSHLERRALLGSESPTRMPRVSVPPSFGRRFAAAAVIALAVLASYVTWSFTREPRQQPDRYAMKDEARSHAKQTPPQEERSALQREAELPRGMMARPSVSNDDRKYAVAPQQPTAKQNTELFAQNELVGEGKADKETSTPVAPPAIAVAPRSVATTYAEDEPQTIALAVPSPTNAQTVREQSKGKAAPIRSFGMASKPPADTSHDVMPVLGPDLASQPAGVRTLAKSTYARGRQSFIVAGTAPALADALDETMNAVSCSRPAATSPATTSPSSTRPTATTQPAPASAPTTQPVTTTTP